MYQKIIIIVCVLALVCAFSEKAEKASDYMEKEKALWDGSKYTDPNKAIEYLNKAIEVENNNAGLYHKRATAYFNLSDYQRAVNDYSETIRLAPNEYLAYLNRGNAYANSRQFEKAVEDFSKVIGLQPDNVPAYYGRSIVYFNQRSNKLGCDDAQILCRLGTCDLLKMTRERGLCR
jgi:tetratricopeptide (TPR) repeat protein